MACRIHVLVGLGQGAQAQRLAEQIQTGLPQPVKGQELLVEEIEREVLTQPVTAPLGMLRQETPHLGQVAALRSGGPESRRFRSRAPVGQRRAPEFRTISQLGRKKAKKAAAKISEGSQLMRLFPR